MKTTSNVKTSGHSLLGIAGLSVVIGIVFSFAGIAWIGGVLVGVGVLLASIAAFRLRHLIIW